MLLSQDALASLLAGAYQDGWAAGHALTPPSDPHETFLGYQIFVEDMMTENVKH